MRSSLLVGLMLLAGPRLAEAHDPSSASVVIDLERGSLVWRALVRDLVRVVSVDLDGDLVPSATELRLKGVELARYLSTHVDLSADGVACGLSGSAVEPDEAHATIALSIRCSDEPVRAELRYDALFDVLPHHRAFVQVLSEDGQYADVLSARRRVLEVEVGTTSWVAPLAHHVVEGMIHIFVGYDHILFLLALLLAAVLTRSRSSEDLRSSWLRILKVVTAFTLAHSVTLALASLEVVQLPSRWVEVAIAATVVFAAINNIHPMVVERAWVLTWLFGLIHGFGFASVLGDLGLPRERLLSALFGFNVGVELGQVMLVATVLPVLFLVRPRPIGRWVLRGGSAAIAAVGLVWMTERALPKDIAAPEPIPPAAQLAEAWPAVEPQALTRWQAHQHLIPRVREALEQLRARAPEAIRAALDGDLAPAVEASSSAGLSTTSRAALLSVTDLSAALAILGDDPEALRLRSVLEVRRGRLEEGLALLDGLAAASSDRGAPLAMLRLERSVLMRRTGRVGAADSVEEAFLDELETVSDPAEAARWARLGSDLVASVERWPTAAALAELARRRAAGVGDRLAEAGDLERLGRIHDAWGRASPIPFYERALARAEHSGVSELTARLHRSLAVALERRRALTEAGLHLRRALERWESLGRWEDALEDQARLASVYEQTRQMEEAAGAYERTLMLARRVGDDARRHESWARLGHVRVYLGQLEEAERAYERAQLLGEGLGASEVMGDVYVGMGNLSSRRGEVEAARRWFERGRTAYGEAGQRAKAQRVARLIDLLPPR